MVSFRSWPLYLMEEKALDAHSIGGWVGHRDNLDVMGKRTFLVPTGN